MTTNPGGHDPLPDIQAIFEISQAVRDFERVTSDHLWAELDRYQEPETEG